MKLNQTHIVSIVCAFGAVVLSGVIHVWIREWYRPDLRYEAGSYYRTANSAVASLKLHNFGQTDVDDIIIQAAFPSELADISTSDPAQAVTIVSGGVGRKFVAGRIERLSPDQAMYVYFAVKAPAGPLAKEFLHFVRSVSCKGRMAKEGIPSAHGRLIFPAAFLVVIALLAQTVIYSWRTKSIVDRNEMEASALLESVHAIEQLNEDLQGRVEERTGSLQEAYKELEVALRHLGDSQEHSKKLETRVKELEGRSNGDDGPVLL